VCTHPKTGYHDWCIWQIPQSFRTTSSHVQHVNTASTTGCDEYSYSDTLTGRNYRSFTPKFDLTFIWVITPPVWPKLTNVQLLYKFAVPTSWQVSSRGNSHSKIPNVGTRLGNAATKMLRLSGASSYGLVSSGLVSPRVTSFMPLEFLLRTSGLLTRRPLLHWVAPVHSWPATVAPVHSWYAAMHGYSVSPGRFRWPSYHWKTSTFFYFSVDRSTVDSNPLSVRPHRLPLQTHPAESSVSPTVKTRVGRTAISSAIAQQTRGTVTWGNISNGMWIVICSKDGKWRRHRSKSRR